MAAKQHESSAKSVESVECGRSSHHFPPFFRQSEAELQKLLAQRTGDVMDSDPGNASELNWQPWLQGRWHRCPTEPLQGPHNFGSVTVTFFGSWNNYDISTIERYCWSFSIYDAGPNASLLRVSFLCFRH